MNTKYWLILLLELVLTLTGCSSQRESFPEGAITNFKELKLQFKHPSKEYGTAPLYTWNSVMTREGIKTDLEAFKEAGFGGIFIHPRPGLITEYLSDEWFELFRYTVDKGKELGMNVWIYDENSYPSGFAGGHVSHEMPEAANQGQGLKPKNVTIIPDDIADYSIVLKKNGDKYEDITSKAVNNKMVEGEYVLYKKTYYADTWYGSSGWFGEGSYVDLLLPGVTEKFIELTMTGYEKIAGDEFGKTVPGVFTDEPEINSSGGIRWTPDLFEVFEKQWGYDLTLNLPSLSEKVGDWKKVRHNYTKTLLWLFIERWSKPQYKYCQEKGLTYTGHYWEHGWPNMQLGPDNMAMYAYHQMPGIDMLFNQFNEESPGAQFGNVRSVKELASVANQLGRHRTLCETYGGSGYDLTFEDMKRLGDWEYALGVNFLNQHLSYYTLTGARKYDWPGSFQTHAPWWGNYKHLCNYYKRLSLVMSSGKQKNDILVIEPTSTAWMYDSYLNKEHQRMDTLGNTFQWFVTNLEKNQVEYDLGSEDIINNHGSVSGQTFIVGKCNYSKVVIPPLMENLNESTFLKLKEFVGNGGELITFSEPKRLDGAYNEDVVSLFKRNSIKHFSELKKEILTENFKNQDFEFVEIKGGNLFHNRRMLEDGQMLFLVNSSLDESTSGEFLIKGKDAILLDPFTGEFQDYKESKEGGNIRIQFSLFPAESLLLYISKDQLQGYDLPFSKGAVSVQAHFGMEIRRSEHNVLAIDFCDLTVSGQTKEKDLHSERACSKAFLDNGYHRNNPWGGAVQYKTNIADKKFDKKSGFIASYWFDVKDDFDYKELTAVVENPGIWSVFINGNKVKAKGGVWKIDQYFGVYPIGEKIKHGKNEVTIKCYPMSIFAEIAPIYIMGDFSLEPASKGWAIKAPVEKINTGSWKKQGLPFYPWGMMYKKSFGIKEKAGRYTVGVGEWKGTAVEVRVNGNSAGTIALHSDRLDITQWINTGINEIEIEVIGSFKNLLGPFHRNPPQGFAGWGNWRNISEYPEGSKYDQLDYGLMDDFYLFSEQKYLTKPQ